MQSYHCFVTDAEELLLLRISNHTVYDTHKLNNVNLIGKDTTNFQPGKYIACFYNDEWYLGLVLKIYDKNQDVNVKFMYRNKYMT